MTRIDARSIAPAVRRLRLRFRIPLRAAAAVGVRIAPPSGIAVIAVHRSLARTVLIGNRGALSWVPGVESKPAQGVPYSDGGIAIMLGHAFSSEHDLNGLVQDIIDNTSSVIYVKDTTFRYRLINRQFETLFGISRQQIVGKTDYECFPANLADGFRKNDVFVAERGQALECDEVAPHADGLHSYLSLKFPLWGAHGDVVAVAGISTDITDRLNSRRELESLKHRYELILSSVTDGICGLDAAGRIVFLNMAAQQMLGWSVDELRGQSYSRIIAAAVQDYDSRAVCPIAAVLRGDSGPQVADGRIHCRDGRRIPVEFEATPILEAGSLSGAVITFHDLTDRITTLRIEHELRVAHKVQQALYPQRVPQFPRLDVAGVSLPSRLACGDYYDFLPTNDQSLLVAVGDVSGHGLGPALEMVGTRASLRVITSHESDLGVCLGRLNRVMSADLPEGMFVTLLLARFDRDARSLIYAAGGHEALIVRATGESVRLNSTGPVLGLLESARFTVSPPLPLGPGDVILIPTDGLTESMSSQQELFGWERAAQIIRQNRDVSAQTLVSLLCDAANQFAAGGSHHDDVTAVVVRITE